MMMQKLQYILQEYDAHVLAYPHISNTELIRDEFISDTGNVFYSDLKARPSQIEFQIEFKGDKCTIRENRARVSKLLDIATITFDDEVFYKGRFLEAGIETRYFYQVVTYKGSATAFLYTQSYEVKRNEVKEIFNNGDLKTPVRIVLKGNGSNIKITGFESTINIKELNDELVIDAEKGISDSRGVNNVKLYAFPYIKDKAEIRLYGTGSFRCFIEFEGRVIC